MTGAADVVADVQARNPGDSVVLTVQHGGTSRQVSVKLANRAL